MKSLSPSEPRGRLFARARQLSLRDWADVAVAVKELAIARAKLRQVNLKELMDDPVKEQPESALRLAKRVRLAIGRTHHRVPWRADCLVQAIAGRRWLDRRHVLTRLTIGVDDGRQGELAAHAWLTCGGEVVTGGDVSRHVPLKRNPDVQSAR